MSDVKGFVFEIEEMFGNTLMSFIVDENGCIHDTVGCSWADTEGDYIYNTKNELIRIQSEEVSLNRELSYIKNDVFYGLTEIEKNILMKALSDFKTKKTKESGAFEIGTLERECSEKEIGSAFDLINRLKEVM